MLILKQYAKNNLIKLVLLLAVFVFLNNNLQSQDYFGKMPNQGAGDIQVVSFNNSNVLFVGIWGNGIYKKPTMEAEWAEANTGITNKYITDIQFNTAGAAFTTTFGGGIFRSSNDGANWAPINNGLGELRVTTISILDNNWIFAGTYGGGIYRSTNNGNDWVEVNNGMRYRDISKIIFTTHGRIVAGTFGGGVYTSPDSGNTWQRSNTGLTNLFVNDMVTINSGEIYLGSNGSGVFNSVNGGVSWERVDSLNVDTDITALAYVGTDEIVAGTRYKGLYYYDDEVWFKWMHSPTRNNGINAIDNDKLGNIIAAPSEGGLLISTNRGRTWVNSPNPMPKNKIAVFPLKNQKLISFDSELDLAVSDNQGMTWTDIGASGLTAEPTCYALDTLGFIYVGTLSGLYISIDGNSFTSIGYTDTTITSLAVSSNNTVFIAWHHLKTNDEGEVIADKKGLDFIAFESGRVRTTLETETRIVKIGVNFNRDLYAVLQSNGVWLADNADYSNWRKLIGLDAMAVDLDFIPESRMVVATNEGLFSTSNKGASWQQIQVKNTDESIVNDITQIVTRKDGTLYAVGGFNISIYPYVTILKSEDDGDTWESMITSYNQSLIKPLYKSVEDDLYFFGHTLYKSINKATLTPPTFIELDGIANSMNLNPEFTWRTTPKSELVQLELSRNSNFTFSDEAVTLGDSIYKIENALDYNTRYYYRLRSKTHRSVSNWIQGTFITTIKHPELHLPENNAVGIEVVTNLHWFPVDGASMYNVELATDEDFDDIIFEVEEATDTTVTTPMLPGMTKFYWRVKAMNADSHSAWSEVWNFTTVPGPPMLISPVNETRDLLPEVTFVWSQVGGTQGYEIEVATDEEFEDIFKTAITENTTIEFTGFDYDITYFWRVRTNDQTGVSLWSAHWEFSIGIIPVVLLTPEIGATGQPTRSVHTWEPHDYGLTFRLQVSSNSGMSLPVFDEFIQVGTNLEHKWTLPEGVLNNNTVYYWRMRYEDSQREGLWSEVWSYKTRISKPQLRMPANNAKEISTDPLMEWFSVVDAERYHLQISRDAAFDDLIFSQDNLTELSRVMNDLEMNITYYWRVRAINAEGLSDWSEVWNFTVTDGKVYLQSPEDKSDEHDFEFVRIVWQNQVLSESYDVQVSRNNDFSDLILSLTDHSGLSYSLEDLEPETTYWWRVRGKNSDGWQSAWSEVWTFITRKGTSVRDPYFVNELDLFPNPANDKINITLNSHTFETVSVSIYEFTGKLIATLSNFSIREGENQLILNVEGLNSGTYILSITNAKNLSAERIVIISR